MERRYHRCLFDNDRSDLEGNTIKKVIKRVLDFLFALIVLIIVSPFMIVIAILIGIVMGRPVMFRQLRPGEHNKPFTIYKFRTMLNESDKDGNLLPDQLRLTKLGRFLRTTSLDELPEVFNVLRGEMSFVGPRPLRMEYLEYYTKEQMRRHEVKPGITGWAQINGRNLISWEERFELDVWYVDHWNLFLDLKILLKTVFKVLKREGISAEGYATMPEFKGGTKV